MADDWFKQNAPPASGDWFAQNASNQSDLPLGQQPASFGGVVQTMGGQAGRALGAAWENFSPLQTINALLPWNTPAVTQRMIDYTTNAVGRTRDALKQGNYKEAGLSAAGAIPLIGPPLEQVSRDIAAGNGPEAVGHVAGLAAMGYLPKGVGAVAEAAPEVSAVTRGVGGALWPELRGLLTGINPLQHPLKVIPDLVDSAGRLIEAGRGALSPDFPTPEDPFKPNPAIAKKMQYGGPAPSQADARSYAASPKGFTVPEGSLIPPPPGSDFPNPEPFKPNPAIAKKIRGSPNLSAPGGTSFAGRTPGVRPSQRFSDVSETPPAPPSTDPMLDQIAQGYGYKTFDKVPLAQQGIIRQLAAKVGGGQQAPPMPGPPSSEPALTASELKAMNQQVNRDAHVNARDIFGNNAGHGILHDAAKQVYGTDSWGKLTLPQKTAINEYIQSNQQQLMKLNDPGKIVQAITQALKK